MKTILKNCEEIIKKSLPGKSDSLYRKIFKYLQEKELLKYTQKRNKSEIILTPTKQTKIILSWVKKEIRKQGKI